MRVTLADPTRLHPLCGRTRRALALCSHLAGSLDFQKRMFFNAKQRCARRKHMERSSRRQFLKTGSAVAAAAGVAAAVPAGAARALTKADNEPEKHLPADDPSVDVPVVAHVTNVRKGL